MTPQEADIIKDVFAKLKAMSAGATDAEAAGLVEAQLRADRGAGLALVQALVMTDRERAALAQENDALKQKIQSLEASGAQAQPASGGLFGGSRVPQTASPWDRPAAPPVPPPLPPQAGQGGPWGGQPPATGPWGGGQPTGGPFGGGQPSGGGGFWGSALRTGAGVAGGLFAFEALKGLFGGGHAAQASGMGLFDQQPTTIINETNIFEGDRTAAAPPPAPQTTDGNGYSSGGFLDNASYDDGGGFDGGFDDDNYA